MKTINLTLKINAHSIHNLQGELIIGVTKICDAIIQNPTNLIGLAFQGIHKINQFETRESIKTYPKIIMDNNMVILIGHIKNNKLTDSKSTLLTILRLFCEYHTINIQII